MNKDDKIILTAVFIACAIILWGIVTHKEQSNRLDQKIEDWENGTDTIPLGS